MEAVARQLILTRHRSVPQNERSMNKYSCGNDPQPGDVVEVVTMEDLPEESWWNQAITEKLQKEKHYSVFAVAFGDWICLFNKPEIIWHHPSRFRLIRRAGETDNKRNIFEELIQTIERTAVNNTATISNVKLWAKSWREEWVGEPERERGWTINGEQPQPDLIKLIEGFGDFYMNYKNIDPPKSICSIIREYLESINMQPQPDYAKLLEEKEREIERLKEQVNDLKMDAAAHEYNEIERLRYQEEYERQLLEEKDEAIRELVADLEQLNYWVNSENTKNLITKYKQP